MLPGPSTFSSLWRLLILTCVYMLGSPTGMTWSSGNSRDAIAADTLFFFSLFVTWNLTSFWVWGTALRCECFEQTIDYCFMPVDVCTYLGYVKVTMPVSLVP